MSTSDIDVCREHQKKALKTAFVYLLVSVFCALLGAVYELFSHEVYSYYMIYAFAFPLVGGTLPFFAFAFSRAKRYPRAVSRNLYHTGIAVLTVGSILRGVLEIYGTTNRLIKIYWILGIVLTVIGAILCILNLVMRARD